MAITLAVGGTSIALPEDMYWSDQYAWAPVEQTVERSITGALIIQASSRVAGAPVTLASIDESTAWMPLTSVQQLMTWAAIPLQQMTLTINGSAKNVIFRHQDGPLEAKPVVFYNDQQSADNYIATLRFMEI